MWANMSDICNVGLKGLKLKRTGDANDTGVEENNPVTLETSGGFAVQGSGTLLTLLLFN